MGRVRLPTCCSPTGSTAPGHIASVVEFVIEPTAAIIIFLLVSRVSSWVLVYLGSVLLALKRTVLASAVDASVQDPRTREAAVSNLLICVHVMHSGRRVQ